MSSTSSTSSTTSTSGTSTAMSGMISGLDTDSLVKSMLSNIQTKMDENNQQKQVLEWKQDLYRGITTDISEFQSKYLDILGSNTLRTADVFNKMTTSSSSAAVTINSDSSGTARSMSIQVAQTAAAASVKGGKSGAGAIALQYDESFFSGGATSASIKVSLDGVSKTITIDSAAEDKLASFQEKLEESLRLKHLRFQRRHAHHGYGSDRYLKRRHRRVRHNLRRFHQHFIDRKAFRRIV
ncbi:MAG: flagellar cap protein FliD N-terminal domain-containing protein [Oscillospiraceae bacterium]